MVDDDSLIVKNLSYIKARDPSVIAGSLGIYPSARRNLNGDFSDANNHLQQNDHLEIFVRLRNSSIVNNLYEISDRSIICNVPETSQWYRNQKPGSLVRRTYKFSKIFPTTSTQADIFNRIVKPKLFSFITGQDSTLLTYGISGSGKTYTIMGTDENPGIIPRAFEYLFKTIKVSKKPIVKPLPNGEIKFLNETDSLSEIGICKNLISSNNSTKINNQKQYLSMQSRLSSEPAAIIENESDLKFEIWVTFAEIYNENIYDLLQINDKYKVRPKLRLGLTNGQSFIKDLTTINVTSALQAYQLMQYGLQNVNFASTKLNSHSSRSHAIFQIKLVQISETDHGVSINNFNFCDLAGSERLKKTMNVGDRLKESNNINLSLLVLSRCIKGVYNMQNNNDKTTLPFRESKLTQLFQNAISGNENICMVVSVNLNSDMFDETLHVLQLAGIANEINIDTNLVKKKRNIFKEMPSSTKSNDNEHNKNEDVSLCEYIQQLEDALMTLQNELEQEKIEHEEHEAFEHQRLVKGYDELLSDKENFWRKRLNDEVNDLKEEYQDKIESLKEKYEEKLYEQERFFLMKIHRLQTVNCNEIIEISDSSDDEGKKKFHGKTTDLKQQEIDELKLALSQRDGKIQQLSGEISNLKSRIDELKIENVSLTNN